MPKPNVLMLALAALLAAASWSGTARADCAVGGFVTNKSKGAIQQLLAFTTNGTFFLTYAGAITSGTSGCSSSGIVKDEYEQEVFVAQTFDGLTQDMARGEGGYLRSFAALMGCDRALYPEFAQWSQAHLADLAVEPETPRAWVGEMKRGLAAHPRLSGCTRIS
jgi:hypothetical protein